MWYIRSVTRRASTVVLFFLVAFIFYAVPVAQAAPNVNPDDTPIPVVADTVDEWAVGGGLLYWANSCFGEEFPPPSVIKRQPVGGGTSRVLETTGEGECLTYLNMTAADDGVYYYDDAQDRIEMIPIVEPSASRIVVDVPNSQQPTTASTLRVSSDYVYWPSANAGKIFRALRAGGPIETVAEGLPNPLDVLVLGVSVYWTDNGGVHSIQTNCGALPCNGTIQPFSAFAAGGNTGRGLFYRASKFNYTIAWVERTPTGPTTNSYAIRQRTCSFNAVCTFNTTVTVYAAAANWVIGPPVTDGSSLFWTERYSSQLITDGKVRRQTIGANDAVDIAASLPGIDRRLVIANGNVFFAVGAPSPANQYGIYRLPLNASAIMRDFAASAWEVTQGIQNTANAVLPIAGKTTYVRFYGSELSGPNAPVVEAKLYGMRDGAPLPGSPIPAINGVLPLAVGGGFERVRLNDGWYFLLPESWTSGFVSLRAEVDPRMTYTDPNRANNALTTDLFFRNEPPVCVWTVPVRTDTPLPSIHDPNFWEMVDRFKVRWPVPSTWVFRDTEPVEETQLCFSYGIPYPCGGPYELDQGWSLSNGIPDRDKVILSLWARAQLSYNPDACDDIGAPVHFMGMVHPDANTGNVAGYASLYSTNSWVRLPQHYPNPAPLDWYRVREGSVMAQELAHNYGRRHVNCGNPDDIDSNYPYPPCQIANVGPDSYYGFDVRSQTPIAPNGAADFMSYANNTWVSDYTWQALLNSYAAAETASTKLAPQAGDVVFAAGFINMESNQGKLNNLLVIPAASLPPQALAATHAQSTQVVYKLRLLDTTGIVLHEESITPLPLDDHSGEGEPALFSTTFAPPVGQVAKVQLLADNDVLDTLSMGVNLPLVAVQQPTAAAVIDSSLTISWTASDPDPGDILLYTVQYSYDNGGHWHTLVNDHPGSPTGKNSLALADLGSLHASNGQTAEIRVLASDGYHTGIGTSATFTVLNRKPDAFVISPTAGQSFAAGIPVLLRGGATDAEDGGLSDSALAWKVDGSAAGSGSDVTAAGLAPGLHNAMLTATDAANASSSISVGFEIAPLGIPASSAPQLNGFCDDATYANGVDIHLAPYANGDQATVTLLRAANQLWACFSGLRKANGGPGAIAGLRVDVDNSRDSLAQSTDYGFFVGENGDVITVSGNGGGGFTNPGPGGLQAQVSSNDGGWSAELRIEDSSLGGQNHMVGLALGHYGLTAPGDDYRWPYKAVNNQPSSWAMTALGVLPTLTSLEPYTATVNSPAISLELMGGNFTDGTVALWNDIPLPTTFVDPEHLTAMVSADLLSNAGTATITTRSPAPDEFVSNVLPFVVEALPPVITQLSPPGISASSPTTILTVNGANFSPDAKVLWNGNPLPTTFINPGKLTAQVAASLLANSQIAGIAVRNLTPQDRMSLPISFEVTPAKAVYLPVIVIVR
ncbi:MAG: fibronectin type III domain-containing protein [Caldilineales bacterium]|nr:fibronectin type III domain-containing protein [Caldilineales bacterium]